jgi:glycerophosphoryl diester phosphodiesterase
MTALPHAFLQAPLAHRGLHDRASGVVENSRDAFEAAITAGFGIELDVQLSGDGQAMVFHDYDLARLTGQSGAVQQTSGAALQKMRLTDSANRIETLPAILEQIAGRVPLLIELKDQDGAMGGNIGALETATVDALADYSGPVALMSFNPHSTVMLHKLRPDLPCGIVTSAYDPNVWPLPKAVCDHLRDIPDFEGSGASFISHEVADLDRPRVAELKAQGASILCWTVRSQEQADEALKIAQNITFEGFRPA